MVDASDAVDDGRVAVMAGWVNLLITKLLGLLPPSNGMDNQSRPNREKDLNLDVYTQVNTYSLEIGTIQSERVR
jgi:hypothetical protein